jgi:hypothetical protein
MSPTLKRSLKNLGKDLLQGTFHLGQRFGFDILPRHFYSEIPDIGKLRNTTAWRKARSFSGVRSDLDAQAAWLETCAGPYSAALGGFGIHREAVKMNGSDEGYGEVEADFLYCFVRAMRPKQIVQIGCGVSTAVCLLAARDEGYVPEIVCVEPYPTQFLKRESEAGRIRLIAKKVEEAGPGIVEEVTPGGLFFVDSSHTLAPAGEVNLIILEFLPRLTAGAYAHFHDIHFPYDYAPDTISSALFFQHETALLYAFLVLNPYFEIAASLAMLHRQRLEVLERAFPEMKARRFEDGLNAGEGQYPSSIFLRRVG